MFKENYEKAYKLGRHEYNQRRNRRENPFLPVLDEVVLGALALPTRPLHLVTIPLERIVGTATHGRTSAFAANFMPLLDMDSEFAIKWEALYSSVIEEGVNSPIKAYEYMNRFYVIEGNKRVSVMKFLDAVSIEGEVTRLIPPDDGSEESKIYREFLPFYEDTEANYVWFSRPGGFTRLYELTGTTPGERWSSAMRNDFHSAYMRFSNCYHRLGGGKLSITTGDAFLIYLEIYGYVYACESFGDTIQENIRKIWDEFKVRAQNESVVLLMEPTAAEEATGFLASLRAPKRLNAAFLYNRSPSESGWTYWHEMGRCHVDATLEGRVTTISRESSVEDADQTIDELVKDGADVVFTTSPVFLNAAIKASVAHPDVRFLNCSLLASFHHVRSYYLRMYEAKFVIGAIAGALAETNRIGYIADYPIFGTPSSINAFALGARLANPRAQIFLEWSTLRDHDVLESFRRNGVGIICNRDISAPGNGSREFGLYRLDDDMTPVNLAMPVWNWGKLYETILNSLLSGSWKNDADGSSSQALGYWPGFSTGAIDVFYSQRLPVGTQRLADVLRRLLQSGEFNPFSGKIVSQDGVVQTDGDDELSPGEIITMDWLCDNVLGTIPDLSQLKPEAHPIVRLQGINDGRRPDPSTFSWTRPEKEETT